MSDKPALAIVIHSGAFDRVHYALVLAAAAAAIDRPVRLFFTMDACRALRRPGLLAHWAAAEEALADKGLATFQTLLESCAGLGVAITVCELGLAAAGLTATDLRDDVPIAVTGAVTFLKEAGADAQMLLV